VNTCSWALQASKAALRLRSRSLPVLQSKLAWWPLRRALGVTCIPHRSHFGRGTGPSSKMQMVSSGWRWAKWRRRLSPDGEDPAHPATGQSRRLRVFGKLTRYLAGAASGASKTRWGTVPCLDPRRWCWRELWAKAAPHSGQATRQRCRLRYVSCPSTPRLRLYASVVMLLRMELGVHVIASVFSVFVFKPILSNRSAKASMEVCSHSFDLEPIIPSSA
jgi:hypothetical protein